MQRKDQLSQKTRSQLESYGLTNGKELDKARPVQSSLIIMATPQKIYEYCRNLQNFKTLIPQIAAITEESNEISLWHFEAVKGKKDVRWRAQILSDIPEKSISWRTIDGDGIELTPGLHHAGILTFQELSNDRGTLVSLQALYELPGGILTKTIEDLMGEGPYFIVSRILFRLRNMMEAGEIPSIEGQPRGGMQEIENPNLH